jgi:hypothetical protein
VSPPSLVHPWSTEPRARRARILRVVQNELIEALDMLRMRFPKHTRARTASISLFGLMVSALIDSTWNTRTRRAAANSTYQRM